jgi:restriction system protein
MAKRGFFAEINYQAQQAEKRRRQQEAAATRAQATAVREAERTRKAAERARAAAARASAAERKAAEKQAAQLHVEARLAEVESMNADLVNTYAEIDGLLASTLEVDDFVDLEALKITRVEHPPFDPGRLGHPTPPMPALEYEAEPAYVELPAPTGLAATFGGKKKHQEAIQQAQARHQEAIRRWQERCQGAYNAYLFEQERREQLEADRLQKIAAAEADYHAQCDQRDADAAERNARLAQLINNLAFDVPDAIEEYVGIVLSNSVYPEAFPVTHEHAFDLSTRELTLTVRVPEPSAVPSVKEYRYVKAKDEIAPAALPVKAQKDRYANAAWQVAVRTLHDVFEADRAGKVHSVALTVGVDRVAPATGRHETVPLAVVAADRDMFSEFDLANVVPHATLLHLGAALSKSPFDLTPADTSAGVRVRAQG